MVDDKEDLRFFLQEELSERYQILGAANGKEGYQTALKSNPDLMISDVMMPEMDGIELCKKNPPGPRNIEYSNYPDGVRQSHSLLWDGKISENM